MVDLVASDPIGDILAEPAPERLDRHECSRATARGRSVTRSPPRGRSQRDDRRRRPTRRSAGPFGAEPAQNIDGVLAVGARIGPEPYRAFVVEIEAVERELVRPTRRVRCNPEAPATLRPAVAEIGILMDMGFVQVDQPMAVVLGTGQYPLDLLDKGPPTLRVGPAEPLFGLLPRQSQTMQGGADRLAAAGPAEPLAHPADQTPQGPAR